MNNERRKSISIAATLIERARDMLDDAKNEEQDAFDNMPESLQESERGQLMEETIGVLEEAYTGLDTALDELNAVDQLLLDVKTEEVRRAIT